MSRQTGKTRFGQTSGRSAKTFPPTGQVLGLSTYTPSVGKDTEQNIHGGLELLGAAGAALDSGTDIVRTTGIGKLVLVVNAGTDLTGTMTVTGTSVDRGNGVETASDTELITVSGLTTDGSDTDGNSNVRHAFTGAYSTTKWFRGSVTISTTDLTITDVDVYHCSFEQMNNGNEFVVETFDINLKTAHASAQLDAYLYSVQIDAEGKMDIERLADFNTGVTAIDLFHRLRYSGDDGLGIGKALNGSTDGIFIDAFTSGINHIDEFAVKVWIQLFGSATNAVEISQQGKAETNALLAQVKTRDYTFEFVNPVTGQDFILGGIPVGSTVVECYAITESATSVLFSIVMRARATMYSGGTNIVNAQGATTVGGTKALASTTLTADNVLRLTTSTVAGTPDRFTIILKCTVDQP
jgi:hypothetical protein